MPSFQVVKAVVMNLVLAGLLLHTTLCASISVSSSSSSEHGSSVVINGKRYEPGNYHSDGMNVKYDSKTGSSSCSRKSVHVTSNGDETTVMVDEDKECQGSRGNGHLHHHRQGTHGHHHHGRIFDSEEHSEEWPPSDRFERIRNRIQERFVGSAHVSIQTASGSGGTLADSDEKDEQNTIQSELLNNDDLMGEMSGTAEALNQNPGSSEAGVRMNKNEGTGASGEVRKVQVEEDGVFAHAATSGNGPHHEEVKVTRNSWGTSVSASASSRS